MKLRAALEYEKVRSNEDGLNKVVLHKDGKFYHAYEWSAWLIKTIVCTEEIQKERGDAKLLLEDVRDMDFILWLTKKIILLNPKENCKIVGAEKDWNGLDRNKSLFYTGDGLGLPIGNLTSQLFSNVYLNIFDQFMKRTLHCRYYGRYVDDAYVVSTDKDFLYSIVPKARKFLKETLGLDLHMGKVEIHDAKYGVEFLGAFVKPFRKYMANESLSRSIKRINGIKTHDIGETYRSVNSFLGTLMHYSSYNIRCNLFLSEKFLSIAPFDKGITKMMKPLQIS